MSLKYSQGITWTSFSGFSTTIEITGDQHNTMDDVITAAVRSAGQSGWTYPKWWQWWRRKDTRPRLSTGGSVKLTD